MVTRDAGDAAGGKARLEEALTIYRAMGNRNGEAGILGNLGLIAYGQGNFRAARALLKRALAMNKEVGNGSRQASNLHNLGLVSRELEEHDASLSLHREALALWVESGDRQAIAECLESIGGHAALRGKLAEAARIWGAAERLREEIGAPILPGDRERYDRDVIDVRTQTGEHRFAAAWVEGRGMTLDQVIEKALESPALEEV
jgi:tetratricopeptide (TPR) repeat protein